MHGGIVSSLPWLTALAATPVGGFVSDWLGLHLGQVRWAHILITLGYSSSGLLLLVAALVPSRPVAVLAVHQPEIALPCGIFILDDGNEHRGKPCGGCLRFYEHGKHPWRHRFERCIAAAGETLWMAGGLWLRDGDVPADSGYLGGAGTTSAHDITGGAPRAEPTFALTICETNWTRG